MVPIVQPPPSGARETLDVGPRRASLVDRLPPAVRRRALPVVTGVAGVVLGAAVMSWWSGGTPDQSRDRPAPEAARTSAAAVADVRLVMTGVRRPAATPDGRDRALVVDGALLHGRGAGTATVTRISRPGEAIRIRVRALPLALSVNRSYVPIRLRISPRDCALATQWTPSSQPFALTWEDQDGQVRTELGGDHDAALAIEMARFLDAACAAG